MPQTKKTTGKKRGPVGKYRPIMVVQVYKYVKAGLSMTDIIKEFGVNRDTFYNSWLPNHPELREAISLAQREVAEDKDFPDFIYKRLSPELQDLWKKIEKLNKGKAAASSVGRIEALLQDNGKRARQQLFLYALCLSNFDVSGSMSKVNLTKRELDRWVQAEPAFAELVEELQFHKKNWFEGSLMKLVAAGIPAAVIFANKTYNSERGYGTQAKLEVNHTGSVLHGVVDLSEIMDGLSHNTKMELLAAIRQRDQEKNPRLTVTPHERISQEIQEVIRDET